MIILSLDQPLKWRLKFFSIFFFLGLFLFSFPAYSQSNVLVIMTDDLDEYSFDQLLNANKLPNIKKYLLDQGIRFRQSFVNESSCCPSRASFLTGKYCHNTGVYNVVGSEGGMRPFVARQLQNHNLAPWLSQADYYTGLIGKFLNTFEAGPWAQPGWDWWQLIVGYDSRPKMYRVYQQLNQDPSSRQILQPDVYQTKYIGDQAQEFIKKFLNQRSSKNRFFLYLTPHSPHIALPPWKEEGNDQGKFDSQVAQSQEKIVAYNITRSPQPDIIKRKQVIKLKSQGGHECYYRDYFTNHQWGPWQHFPCFSSGDPIVAFSAFPYLDNQRLRQQLIRGTPPNNYRLYYRDYYQGRWEEWHDLGPADSLPGNDPILGFSTERVGNNLVQFLVRGQPNSGYHLYYRSFANNRWLAWQEQPLLWDLNTSDQPIVGLDFYWLDQDFGELRIIRQKEAGGVYREFVRLIRLFSFSGSILGATTETGFTPSTSEKANSFPLPSYEDEAAMLTSINNVATISFPHLMWGARVYADGSWPNIKPYQSYPLSLYGGRYPAGSLRKNYDPNGFIPLDSRFNPPFNKPSFNRLDCQQQHPWLCQQWPDLNQKVINNQFQKDYLTRVYLDRLESMISVDVMVGQVIETLAQKGLLNQTLIIFTSDNGYFNGEHRLGNKILPYEESIRVPLIIRPPQSPLFKTPFVNFNTVVNLDLAPTILDFAQLNWQDPRYQIDGRSLLPLMRSQEPLSSSWRRWFLVASRYARGMDLKRNWLFALGVPDFLALRTGKEAPPVVGPELLWVNYGQYPQINSQGEMAIINQPFYEFYDLKTDPYQLTNLVNGKTDQVKNKFSQYRSKKGYLELALTNLSHCQGESCRLYDRQVSIGDLNQDKRLTRQDRYLFLQQAWRKNHPPTDINLDGTSNSLDFNYLY